MVDRRRLRLAGGALGGVLLIGLGWRALPTDACDASDLQLGGCDRPSEVRAALEADLRALEKLEGAYVKEHWTYMYMADELGFMPTKGVSVSISASQHGWAASATVPSLGKGRGCAIYVGEASGYKPTLMEGHDVRAGEIFCTE